MTYAYFNGRARALENDEASLLACRPDAVILTQQQYDWAMLPENRRATINEILAMELEPLSFEQQLDLAKRSKTNEANNWASYWKNQGYTDPDLTVNGGEPFVRELSEDKILDTISDLMLEELLIKTQAPPRNHFMRFDINGRLCIYNKNEAMAADARFGAYLAKLKYEHKRVIYAIKTADTIEDVDNITISTDVESVVLPI